VLQVLRTTWPLHRRAGPPLHQLRTRTLRHSYNPFFDQTFVLDVRRSELKVRSYRMLQWRSVCCDNYSCLFIKTHYVFHSRFFMDYLRGFAVPRVSSNPAEWHGCLSLVCVVCCQVEISATGRSLIQRNPTECVCVSVTGATVNLYTYNE
jgi:hypothetical protein